MRALFCSLIAGLLLAPAAQAQKPPVEWGRVEVADLEMRSFPADTNATAVVLVDHVFSDIDPSGRIETKRFRRVKLLSAAAFDDWGSFSVSYNANDRVQRVTDVKGQTLTLGADGKVEDHKVDKRDILTEDLSGGYELIRFTFPALAPGAIVEYEYTMQSNSPFYIPDWDFQLSEPVLYSEYVAEYPQTLSYIFANLTRSSAPLPISEQVETRRSFGNATRYHYVAENQPALRAEPFITSLEDYRNSLFVQFAAYFEQGYGERRVLNTWDKLAKELRDHSNFGKYLDLGERVEEEVAQVTAGAASPHEKIVALYDHVRTSYAFDGRQRLLMDDQIRDVLSAKSGSTAELSLLLINMLREADITAFPVLISTRDNGALMTQYPLTSQFNDVVVYASADGREYLLKPTDRYRPYDLLPASNRTSTGLLITDDGFEWIPMQSDKMFRSLTSVDASLSDDGTLVGTLTSSDGDYAASLRRSTYAGSDEPTTFARDTYFGSLTGIDVTVDSAAVENADDLSKPFEILARFQAPGMATAAGDFLYLNPTLVSEWSSNPLTAPVRAFPVDFDWGYSVVYLARIALPEGYRMAEPVKPTSVRRLDGKASYLRQVTETDGVVQVQSRVILSETVFPPERYAELRTFFEEVTSGQAEPLVLTRAPLPAEQAPDTATPDEDDASTGEGR